MRIEHLPVGGYELVVIGDAGYLVPSRKLNATLNLPETFRLGSEFLDSGRRPLCSLSVSNCLRCPYFYVSEKNPNNSEKWFDPHELSDYAGMYLPDMLYGVPGCRFEDSDVAWVRRFENGGAVEKNGGCVGNDVLFARVAPCEISDACLRALEKEGQLHDYLIGEVCGVSTVPTVRDLGLRGDSWRNGSNIPDTWSFFRSISKKSRTFVSCGMACLRSHI